MHCKNHLLILIFDNHSLVNSYYLLNIKTRGLRPLVEVLHHSVNFYFTVLSEPSQDSSHGQFLFYRPVRTVTGFIIDDEEELFVLNHIIRIYFKNINAF